MAALGNEFTPSAAFELKPGACRLICLHHREPTQAGKTSPRTEAKQKTINLKGPLTLSMDPQEDNTDSVLTEVGDAD